QRPGVVDLVELKRDVAVGQERVAGGHRYTLTFRRGAVGDEDRGDRMSPRDPSGREAPLLASPGARQSGTLRRWIGSASFPCSSCSPRARRTTRTPPRAATR